MQFTGAILLINTLTLRPVIFKAANIQIALDAVRTYYEGLLVSLGLP